MTHPLTFPRGGIQLPPQSQESRRAPIANAAMPSVAVVPMRRPGGTDAVCLVVPGDRVAEGQLIGRPADPRSAPVHAPIPGAVVAVREVVLSDGTAGPATVIELGGAFAQSGRPRPARDWRATGSAGTLAAIAAAGVALDGHPEPLAARFAAARRRSPQVLVANAVETEPWLAAEFRLLAERPGLAFHLIQSLIARVMALTDSVRSLAVMGVSGCSAKGLLVGRPMRYTAAQKEELREVLLRRTERYAFPIVADMDFGHTSPQFTLPIGCRARIDAGRRRFEIIEAAVA